MSHRTEFEAQLSTLTTAITKRAREQFDYGESSRRSDAVTPAWPEEYVRLALRTGFAAGWNELTRWDCDAAVEAAREILTDCNCHEQAALLNHDH